LIGTYAEAGQSSTFGGYSHIMSELIGNDDEVSWEGTFLAPRQMFTKSMLSDNGLVGGHWNNSYEVIKFPCRLSNDLHETWNDSIAVLRTHHGEIFISTKDMLVSWDRTKGQKDPLKLYRDRI
jgi:hypothetical protein